MAARDVMFGDGPELIAAAISNGVAHPPGYPLWIVLGHLASLLPVGTPAFRVNLTACAYHALTIGIVYVTAFVLSRQTLSSIFAAFVLAVGSPLFASWSLQAEVFSLNDLFTAAIVLLCVLWLDDPRRWRLIVPLAALFGLGMSNHQSLVMLAPLPLYAAFCGRRAIVPNAGTLAILAAAALALVLSFTLPYAHTLIASQRLEGWQLGAARTFSELVDVVERRSYGAFNLVPGAIDRGASFGERVTAMISAGGWPYAAIAFGLAGLALRKRYRELGLAALIVGIPLLAFCAAAGINVEDEVLRAIFERFALLPLTALAPFAACAVPAFVPAIVALVAVATLPTLSLANVHDPRNLYRDVARLLPPHAILLTAGDAVDQTGPYFQSVEHWRPDVTIVTYGLLKLAAYRNELGKKIAVPAMVELVTAPQARRDLLVRANPDRPFYTIGERGIHAPGPLYYPLVTGVVSAMTSTAQHVDLQRQYRDEAALQSLPGYGAVSANRWQSNGFGSDVREYYAGGFFSTGIDAERLGNPVAALSWYRRAGSYSADPLIGRRIDALFKR